MARNFLLGIVLLIFVVLAPVPCIAEKRRSIQEVIQILLRSYPAQFLGHEGNQIIWADGEKMAIDDGVLNKTFDELLNRPDIEDQFYVPYPLGPLTAPPSKNHDPGRVRYEPFFVKMYGDPGLKGKRPDQVPSNFKSIIWLPKKWGKKIRVTKINGVADKLQRVSDELDQLPDEFLRFLKPKNKNARKYVPSVHSRRCIAGTSRYSVHAFGAAIDLAFTEYWRTSFRFKRGVQKGTTNCSVSQPELQHTHAGDRDHDHAYENTVPYEIVRIFEKHGFIWGGKWHHFDTMHFEYRPELIEAAKLLPAAKRD